MWKLYFKSNISIRLTYWHTTLLRSIFIQEYEKGWSFLYQCLVSGFSKKPERWRSNMKCVANFLGDRKNGFLHWQKKPMYYSSTNPYFLIGLFLLNWTKKDLGRTHKYKGNDPILHSRKICLDAKTLSSQNSIWCISTFYIK